MGTYGQGRKAWKLQENVAHGSNVTCLALGPLSGRVMVTGGEDRKVNLWAIGKPQEIMSLSGHTSPVECVQFNGTEELVVAGSQSGTLKIWDLEAAKIVRTLTGHKSNIRSLDFHPYGDFVASGSLDTIVKLWDVRRKGCIISYKGHTGSINHLRFSPDGRWVVSAGEDGIVKLWDLTAGKLLNDFKSHTAAVNRVEFHPKEFLLASGGSDRTVKFLDLETFELVSSTETEPTAVRCIGFHPEGICLFSGAQDSLRLYGWEPSRCYEALSVGWGKVADIAFSSDQLIGASFSQTNVTVWVVDLSHVEGHIDKLDREGVPLEQDNPPISKELPTDQESKPVSNFRKASPQRKAFDTRPRTSSSKSRKPERADDGPNDNGTSDEKVSNVENPVNYDQIFTPRQALSRSPVQSKKHPEPFVAPNDPPAVEEIKGPSVPEEAKEQPTVSPKVAHVPLKAPVNNPPTAAISPYSAVEKDNQPPPQFQFQMPVNQPSPFVPPADVSRHQQQSSNIVSSHQPEYRPPITPVVRPAEPDPAFLLAQEQLRDLAVREPVIVGQDLQHGQPIARGPEVEEDRAIRSLARNHDSICSIMNTRLKNLTAVGQLWTDGEIKGAVEAAANMADHAVLVDLLNVLILKQTLWTLDICVVVLPRLTDMLSSKYESYVETGCNSLKLILKNFAPVIKSNMAAPPASVGVDLVREERFQKCQTCYSHLKHVQDFVNKAYQVPSKLGGHFKEVSLALSILD